ncbi:leucine-rich repeat-containing protein 4 [Hyalella azteca]|uniref:Leucine-rich repeat-containing protein 4 n=1 Tax=Hyalella azteca TaxID=294128 RepID=A0A979FUX5_HYAAZ|nr:leucine-rich repeat-containing protein 4 [Hyalella azteca]
MTMGERLRLCRVMTLLWLLQRCPGRLASAPPAFSCPAVCICLSGSQVLCDGAGLNSVPRDTPSLVEELSFSRNQLSNLTTDMFSSWPKLRVITLDGNQIRYLQPFVFRGLPNVNKISVQRNPLAELPAFSFSSLENVSQINLRNNQIRTIHANAFSGSRNIGMLLLQDNPLKSLKAKAFSGLNTVQFLYLPSWITELEADVFHGVMGVGLLKLQSLDLKAFQPYTFRGLSNVTQISIQDSDLGVLRSDAFQGLRNVGEIRMLNNKVDSLEGLRVGEELNVDAVVVQGNHFLHITRPTPLLLQANNRNVVTGNFFPCTCRLAWLLDTDVARSTPQFLSQNFCVSPYAVHGAPIASVTQEPISPCLSSERAPPVETHVEEERDQIYGSLDVFHPKLREATRIFSGAGETKYCSLVSVLSVIVAPIFILN